MISNFNKILPSSAGGLIMPLATPTSDVLSVGAQNTDDTGDSYGIGLSGFDFSKPSDFPLKPVVLFSEGPLNKPEPPRALTNTLGASPAPIIEKPAQEDVTNNNPWTRGGVDLQTIEWIKTARIANKNLTLNDGFAELVNKIKESLPHRDTDLIYRGSSQLTIGNELVKFERFNWDYKDIFVSTRLIVQVGSEIFLKCFIETLLALENCTLPGPLIVLETNLDRGLSEIRGNVLGINQTFIQNMKDQKKDFKENHVNQWLFGHSLRAAFGSLAGIRNYNMEDQLAYFNGMDPYSRFSLLEKLKEWKMAGIEMLALGFALQEADEIAMRQMLPEFEMATYLNTPLPSYSTNAEPTWTLRDYLSYFYAHGLTLCINLHLLLNQYRVPLKDIGQTLHQIRLVVDALPVQQIKDDRIHQRNRPLIITYNPGWDSHGKTYLTYSLFTSVPHYIAVHVNSPFGATSTFLHEMAHYSWALLGEPLKIELKEAVRNFFSDINIDWNLLNLGNEITHELVAYTAESGDTHDFLMYLAKKYHISFPADLHNHPAYATLNTEVRNLLIKALFTSTQGGPQQSQWVIASDSYPYFKAFP